MASEAAADGRAWGRRVLEVESNSVLIATVALIGVIGIAHPDFLAWGQLKEVVQNAAYVGIIAGGMAFLISMREIDLSVGSMFGLSLISAALFMQHGMNPWLAALLGTCSAARWARSTRSWSRSSRSRRSSPRSRRSRCTGGFRRR